MIRSHTSPADVLELLATGDKTTEQIRYALKLSGNQWNKLRSFLLYRWQIGTVGRGAGKQYTKLNIERTR